MCYTWLLHLHQANNQLLLGAESESWASDFNFLVFGASRLLDLELSENLDQDGLHLHHGKLLADAHSRAVVERLECVCIRSLAREIIPAVRVEISSVRTPDGGVSVHDSR